MMKGKCAVHKNMEGHVILKSEVRSALSKLNRNKAAGPDGGLQWGHW